VPEDAPGFFRSVRADEEEAHHHHIVIVDGLFDGVIRFQETGGQQFAGWLHHHRYAQFVQDIDIFMVEDKGSVAAAESFRETSNSAPVPRQIWRNLPGWSARRIRPAAPRL